MSSTPTATTRRNCVPNWSDKAIGLRSQFRDRFYSDLRYSTKSLMSPLLSPKAFRAS